MRYILLALFLVTMTAQAERTLHAKIVYTSPDTEKSTGALTRDTAWEQASELKVKRQGFDVINLKSIVFEDYIYFRIFWADKTYNNLHKPWEWNAEKMLYVSKLEREDSLIFRWEISSSKNIYNSKNDLWYWGADRTRNYADDMTEIVSENYFEPSTIAKNELDKKYFSQVIGDLGTRCYKTDYNSSIGVKIHRYEPQEPNGSRADILAHAKWENGLWQLEFKRKLTTGNVDDLEFEYGKEYTFDVSPFLDNAHILNNSRSPYQPIIGPTALSINPKNFTLPLYTFSAKAAHYAKNHQHLNNSTHFPQQLSLVNLNSLPTLLYTYSAEATLFTTSTKMTGSYFFALSNAEENFPLKLVIPPSFIQSILENK